MLKALECWRAPVLRLSGVGGSGAGAEGVEVVGATGVVVGVGVAGGTGLAGVVMAGVGVSAGAGIPAGGAGVGVAGAGVVGAALGSGTVSYIVLSGNWTLPITLPCIA